MIKNIIFDFGGVVVTISHDEALRRFTNGSTHTRRRESSENWRKG